MDQGAGKLESRDDGASSRSTRFPESSPPEDADEGSAENVESEDIERTRAHMSETIGEIQDRFGPEKMAEEAKDTAKEVTGDVKDAVMEAVDHAIEEAKAALPAVTEQAKELAQQTIDHAILEAKTAIRELGGQARVAVRDATIGKVERMAHTTGESTKSFGSTLITTIKQNPGPAALTGLGIGWLMMNSKGVGSQVQTSTGTGTTGQRYGTTGDTSGKTKDAASQAKDKAGGAVDQAKGKAGEAVDSAQEVAGKAVDSAQDAATLVSLHAEDFAGKATDQAQQLSARFRRTLDEKPLAVGMVAAAIGTAAALMVPATQKEHHVLGETRDKLMDKAQTGAQGFVEKVQKVAGEAGDAAEKESKYQGLTPEEKG